MAEALDGVGEVQEHGLAGLVHAEACVAALLCGTGCHVAGNEVSECRITALEVVVAVFFRDLGSLHLVVAESLHVLEFLGNPDASVVTKGLAHECELALLVTVDGDTGRMDLCEAGICEESTLPVALHCRRTVGIHCVGGKEIGVSITAGGNDHGVRAEPFELAGHEVAGDDTLRLTVDDDEVEHLVAGIGLHASVGNLLVQGCIGTEKELLAGLSAGVEGTAHLHAAEGAVGKISAVLAGERNSLCHALVDDGCTYLGKTIDVGFTAAVVTALDGVVEEPVDGIVVVLVVLGGIDTALCGDGVRTAGAVADAENLDVVSQFSE